MNVHSTILPDGRYLSYYDFGDGVGNTLNGFHPPVLAAPRIGEPGTSQLRWNPLLNEWVVNATHRQDRTHLPPSVDCPFCPARPGFVGEVPENDYDIVVLENRFPSLQPNPGTSAMQSTDLYPVEPAEGVCEVVLYSPIHSLTLADAPVEQIHKLILVWTSRWIELKKLPFVKYVFIFENKGEAIGVTLHHPHGQIYGYPFVPPRIQKELDTSREHLTRTGQCLICSILTQERGNGSRVVIENESFSAFIPFFARWPYEVHIVARRHYQALDHLTKNEQQNLALIIKAILSAYDRLFSMSFPYMMVIHQEPAITANYDHYHFHIEFYPPLRSANKLKYLAGSETGAGTFVNDTLPETKAAELRSHIRRDGDPQ